MMKYMEHEIDDVSEADKWKVDGNEDDENPDPDEDEPGGPPRI
jgi:hypothetical protein